jgi:murein tripeptide amidase MpaA
MSANAINHDRYYDYEALTNLLHQIATDHSRLAKLSSIGQTFQGREIWLIEITNPDTGFAADKPGYYIDAHIHAEEHVTSSVALYAIDYLLTQYGHDTDVTRLVDQQVFYIFPRLNPDGAEYSLQPPYYRWVGNGRYRPGEERDYGLIPEDLDGDGFIAHVRVPDPDGEWKKSEHDPRLLVQRSPAEYGGEYFRLYPEGRLMSADDVEVTIQKPSDGNLNRNFSIGWTPEKVQYGAGEYPLSEPETRALTRFILDHPNIAGMCTYHSHGGVMLRPSMTLPDSEMHPRDLAIYQALGDAATEITGYPTISVFEGFTPDKSKPRRGGFEDFTYETLGIPTMGPEVWDIRREAGLTDVPYYSSYLNDEGAQAKIFDWVMANCAEMGFRDWVPYDHPDLGTVEIGGMIDIWTYRNPPPHLLRDICHKNVLFNLFHAAAAPRIRIQQLTAEQLEGNLYKICAVVANEGYLPTNLTEVAIQNEQAKPVWLELALESGQVQKSPKRVCVGHLSGRSERRAPWSPFGEQWTNSKKRVEWLIQSTNVYSTLTVIAKSQRAGSHTVSSAVAHLLASNYGD